MANPETYKFLPVKSKTHGKFKILCAKNDKTFDEQLKELMKFKKQHDNATK